MYFAYLADAELGFGPDMERLLGPRRPPHRPWDLTSDADQRDADTAATLQAVTEDALLGLAREVRRRTGETALCLAGGVAFNAVANARLAREAGFEGIFVHPAAGDAGGALGAAILGALELGDPRPSELASAVLGLPIDVAGTAALAHDLGLAVRTAGDVASEVAALVGDGKIGMPIALNTSFDGAGEPIIAHGIDALGFLLGHPIDALVAGDLVITRGAA